MRKLIFLLFLFYPLSGFAQVKESISGYCERGGEVVTTDGRQSTTKVQRTFTSCTVTIYLSGTTTLATIFPGNSGTATKSNPFTADADGYWQFFANPGRYDVRFSGAGIANPFTRSGYWISAGGASALPNCTTAQMLYYAASGSTPACLSLGTNLSISGGVLNAAGGGGGGGSGSVTSVGLTLPDFFTVSNSPITTFGIISASINSQAQRLFLASPTSSTGAPTFRSIVVEDIPALPYVPTGLATSSGLTASATNRLFGRFSSGAGPIQELTLGGGLTIQNGGVLNTTNSGLVTSVGLTLPASIFTVTGAGSGAVALDGTLNSQQARRVFAGPISGSSAFPAFRLLETTDLPNVPTVYNVKTDFGCVGDGVANDTSCILAALTAAAGGSSKSKTIFFPKGTYLTDPITSTLDGMILQGDGQFNSIIKARQAGTTGQAASAGSVFYLTTAGTAHRLVMRDLGIQGAGKAAGDLGYCLYINDSVTYLQGFELSNLDIKNCRQGGIVVPTIFSGVIRNVHTDEIGGNHFDLGRDANTVTLIGNYVHTVDSGTVGFRLRGGTYTLIGNNGMDPDSGTTAQWGLFGSDSGDAGGVAYFTGAFIGNNVEDFGNVGLSLRPGSRLGSVSGSSFSNRASGIAHIAILFEGGGLAGFAFPAGIWDASNRITLVGQSDTWSQLQPIHSREAPFYVVGGNPSQYYDTLITTVQDMPGVNSIHAGALGKTFARSKNFMAETLAVEGTSDGNPTRVDFTTAAGITPNQSYRLPTQAPPTTGVVLSANTNGELSWVYWPLGAAIRGPITTSELTIATNRLAGRMASGSGAIQEIAIGSNLALNNVGGVPTLEASGGSGSTPAGSGAEVQYRVNGTTFGAISTATSDGTNLTVTSGGLRVTSPRITTSLFDSNGNSFLSISPTASAVNQITIANQATGNSPSLSATGSDANLDLLLAGKGTGAIRILGNSTKAGSLQLAEDTDNGSNTISLSAPALLSSDLSLTLPNSAGASGQILQTDGSGNLSWVTPTGGGGNGTVTKVSMTVPTELLSVTGSPVETEGTFALTLATPATNLVFASPNGSTGAPTFRKIVAADITGTLTQNTSGSAGSLSSTLTIASGGTGATTAAAARTALSAATSGANSDITSISGLTTALSIAQGGTGITSKLVADLPTTGFSSVIARYATTSSNPVSGQHSLSALVTRNGLITRSDGVNTFLDNTLVDPVSSRTFYAGSATSGVTTNPTFRTIALSDLPVTGTANSTTFLRGDGQWAVPAGGSSGVTSITIGTGLSGSSNPITTTGTISLPSVGTSGTYSNPSSISVDAQGRVTAVVAGTGGGGSTPAGTGTELQYRLNATTFGASNMSFASNVVTTTCSTSANCLLVQNSANTNRLSFNASGFEIGSSANSTLGGKMSWTLGGEGSSSSLAMDLYDSGLVKKALGLNCATSMCTLDIGSYSTIGVTSNQGRIRLNNNAVTSVGSGPAVILTAAGGGYGTTGYISNSTPTGLNNYGLYLPFNEPVGSNSSGAGVWWAPGDSTNSATAWAGFWFGKEADAGGGFNFQGYAKESATASMALGNAQAASVNIRSTSPTNLQSYGPINFRFTPGRAAGTLTNPVFHIYRQAATVIGSIPYIRLYNDTQTNFPTVATTIVGAGTLSDLANVTIDGSFAYCTNCQFNQGQLSSCNGSGGGTFAMRLSGTWRCF